MSVLLTAHINNSSIKICEINHSPKMTVITRAFRIKTPEGSFDDGKIIDMVKLATVINSEIARQSVTAKEITFIINSSKIAVKEVYTPVLKPQRLRDMIRANAGDYFPVDLDDYILTEKVVAQVVSENGDKQMRVNVLAAPKEIVEQYHTLASKLGFTVKNIEHHSNAAMSLLKRQIGAETSVVLHVHDDATTVNIFKNNVLELQRTVPYGRNVVVRAVMEELKMDEATAEATIAKDRLIHNSFDGDKITDSLRYLINSIVRVVDYYTSRNSDSPVEKAYLTGESVNMRGLENLFANEFNFSVMQIMEFNGVTMDGTLGIDQKYISAFISCAGAVLDPVNFQLAKVANADSKDKSVMYLLIAAGVALVVGGVAVAIPGIKNLTVKSDINSVESKINQIKDIENVVDNYYKAKDMFTDVSVFKNMTSSANDYLLDFWYALEKAQPSDVSIRSLTVQDGSVSISAVTSTKQTIAKFITQLKALPGVTGVYVASTSESKDGYGVVTSTFSIVCKFNSLIDNYATPAEDETVEGEAKAEGETVTDEAEKEVQ